MAEEQLHFFNFKEKSFKKRQISLPLDTLILLLIIIVLLFLLSFSLGVERGRRVVYVGGAKKDLSLDFKQPFKDEEFLSKEETTILTNVNKIEEERHLDNTTALEKKTLDKEEGISKEIKISDENKQKNTEQQSIKKERYIIQIASYTNKERAELELKKLQKKGYNAFISKKGNYLVLFVGEFSSKIDADKSLKSLKSFYHDCFLKTVN